MGAKLLQFYDHVKQAGGAQATMRLAMKTGVPSTKAADAEDSPENLKKFAEAVKEITGQEAPVA